MALASALATVSALSGCALERGVMPVETVRLTVGAQKLQCEGLAGPQTCLQVWQPGSADWQYLYDPIEGFTHEPGWVVDIEVEIYQRGGPPVMDASDRLYRLRRVIRRWQPCVDCAAAR